jgi:hypothetical protein
MKHATDSALSKIEPLLQSIRRFVGLKERTRGVFYFNGQAFLHFHEDPAGLFADLRVDNEFQRFRVNSEAEKKVLLTKIKSILDVS